MSSLGLAPAGFGTACTAHVVPVRPSARGSGVPARPSWMPAATQEDGAVQDTPFTSLTTSWAGLGMSWMAQRVPFHASASGCAPVAVAKAPAAVHLVADRQETALSSLPADPAGLGMRWMAQVVPFHASARLVVVPAALVEKPVPVHAVAEAHDMPSSSLVTTP